MPPNSETGPSGRLSVSAYARHRGLASEHAVRRAINAGRIKKGGDGLIDVSEADSDWEKNTDPAKQRDWKNIVSGDGAKAKGKPTSAKNAKARSSRQPVEAEQISLAHAILRRNGQEPSGGEFTFVDARTAAELQKMEDRQIDMDVKRGKLINKAKVLSAIFDAARRERDSWQQWVTRCVAEMAAELKVDPQVLEQTLDRHVRKHLADLGELRLDP